MFSEYTRNEMEVIKSNRICKVYSASYNAHYYYPYKLTAVKQGWESLDNSCWSMILDSNKTNESITNQEIIDECIERRTEYVIPKDFVGDADKTLNSLVEFEQLEEEKGGIKAQIIPILQFNEETDETHTDHLKEYKSFYQSYSKLAIGGLQKFNTLTQIKIIRDVRKILGKSVDLHAFGIGTSLKIITALRHNPALLDSMDMSTAEQMTYNGSVPEGGISLKQTTAELPTPQGDLVSVINGQYAKANLLKINLFLSDHLNEDKFQTAIQSEYSDKQLEEIIKAASLNPSEIEWNALNYNPRCPESRTPNNTRSLTSYNS